MDNVLGFFTPAWFGIPQILDSVRDRRNRYYLVDRGANQLFVTVSDEFVESRVLTEHIDLQRGTHFAVGAAHGRCAGIGRRRRDKRTNPPLGEAQ